MALESDHQDSDGTPGEVLLERTAAPTPGPDRHLAGSAIRQGVRSCLRELVAARRRAVTLYLMGDSVPRAAERLGWNRKRTENLVFRGLADLRRCLETKGLEP